MRRGVRTERPDPDALAALYQQGLSLEAVARAVGSTKHWVREAVAHRGILRPGRPPAGTLDERLLRSYVEQRNGLAETARRLQMEPAAVEARLQALGVLRARRVQPRVMLPEWALPLLPHALSLVKETLRRVAPPPQPDADADDFYGVARLAALRALATYQPNKGCAWESWVITKVRYAIRDELRRLDHVTRDHRERAARTGEPLPLRPDSLERLAAWENEEDQECLPEPGETPDFDHRLQWLALHQAVAALPERLEHVARRLMEGWTYPAIGTELGLSPSRIQQLVDQIREQFRPLAEEL